MSKSTPEAILELMQFNQWIAYTALKIPVSPTLSEGKTACEMADTTNPATWGTPRQAKHVCNGFGLRGVGFVFDARDPYVGIDLDDAVIDGVVSDWAQTIVDSLDSYTELSPSGNGLHIWVKGSIPHGGSKKKIKDGDGNKIGLIEIYCKERFFTVTGKHLSGTPSTIEHRNLDAFWRAHFDNPEAKRVTAKFESDTPVEEWLVSALDHIDSSCDYHDWMKIGSALKDELGDSGFGYFDYWSSSSSKYEGTDRTQRHWSGWKAGECSIGTVVWMAENNGFVMPAKKTVRSLENHDWAAWLNNELAAKAKKELKPGEQSTEEDHDGVSVRWVNFADAYEDDSPLPPDLVADGFLTTGDIALVFGPPKSMKSMMVLDMCRNWACGKAWFDLTVERPLKIAYMQFELKSSMMRKRIQLAGLEKEDLDLLRSNLFYTDRMSITLTADFVYKFVESIEKTMGKDLDILVIDPIANIYTGDDENNNMQMTQFLRSIKAMRNQINPKTAVILVHHSGKLDKQTRHSDPFNSIRGASALRGAYDSGVLLDITEGFKRRAWFELRNGPGRNPMDVEFDRGRFVNALGRRSDGPSLRRMQDDEPVHSQAPKVQYMAEIGEIVRTIQEQAEDGDSVFTAKQFEDRFGDLFGSKNRFKQIMKEAFNSRIIQLVKTCEGIEFPSIHHRSEGFLVVEDMYFQGIEILPEYSKIGGKIQKL